MKPRVYVAYAGGTIGMRPTTEGYAPHPGSLRRPIEALTAESGDELPTVDLEEFDEPIDSSNATPATWSRIAELLYARRDDFDGFVVLHGTDTMAYTAAALSFLLPDFDKPVVVTGSQVPMCVARSDGRQNLIGALQVAALGEVREVCLLFGSTVIVPGHTLALIGGTWRGEFFLVHKLCHHFFTFLTGLRFLPNSRRRADFCSPADSLADSFLDLRFDSPADSLAEAFFLGGVRFLIGFLIAMLAS